MKIVFEQYNPDWKNYFVKIKNELLELIGFIKPRIEHIGSTSVEGLSAKPIIDILVGVNSEKDLAETIKPLTENNYIYYECFNKEMPYRRFFIKHKGDPAKFALPQIIKAQYQFLKEQLSNKEWEDGNQYNAAKNHFIKTEENKAVHWYHQK